MDPFVHLHVASGYSLRHGACLPPVLVERAAEHGMEALALTDRDGLYGAVRFVKACTQARIRPILGADLAIEPALGGESAPAGRTPVRGGAFVDSYQPRITVLASGRSGWAALCRLVSTTHLRGERGSPVTTAALVAEHAGQAANGGGGLVFLVGPESELGRALAGRRPDLAERSLRQWRQLLPEIDLVVEVASHRGAGDSVRAARMAGFAAEVGLPAVLSNLVRYADPAEGPVVDVLDATRRLVALDVRHVDRRTAEGYLKSGKEMAEIAEEVARLAGLGDGGAGLLARTRSLADRCVLDARHDLGIGTIHFPELDMGGAGADPHRQGSLPDRMLRERCMAGLSRRGMAPAQAVLDRLDDELDVIRDLGYPSYFLTVADVTDLIKGMRVRCAARGSGAGSLVNYLLGVSDVDPIRYGLLMERFLSPLRHQLPDVDIDVESARRTEVYEQVLARYGGERCACVCMMDTYRARHAIRDVGAALGLPPGEIDVLAKSFPHIRANQVRVAFRQLPELRASSLTTGGNQARLDLLLRLVERLDGLPRHIALHPCGVLLSDRTLLDRTPIEASFLGFPMSQFDKDDVEDLGLLKLDLLGIRMQSAMAYAVQEVRRVDGVAVDIDGVARDDPATFALIQSTRTLGCFQIESPGQRELIGKFSPESFEDLIIDISLFRPGPVKSDMVRPFLEARHGWAEATYPHPDLVEALAETCGVVVFHEQVLRLVSVLTGCSLAEADEVRRALGDPTGEPEVRTWFVPRVLAHGYGLQVAEQAWSVLKAFGSFGFCKAHAAAFALPTYQSAWLKAHHPAAFLASVLTHDPGMYPKRLILDDARQFGIAILGLDVNRSDEVYRVEHVGVLDEPPSEILGSPPRHQPVPGLPDGRAYGIRMALTDVKGVSEAEVSRIMAGRPYASLSDFWYRAVVSRPIVERLVLAGGFDSVYGIGGPAGLRRRGQLTRRDLLLQIAELDAEARAGLRQARRRTAGKRVSAGGNGGGAGSSPGGGAGGAGSSPGGGAGPQVIELAARQSQAAAVVVAAPVQLAFELCDDFAGMATGLPELTEGEQVHAELEVLGLDVSRHVLDFYVPLLSALRVTWARDLLSCRSRQEVLVAGVKVATQTPPVRSGRRVVFVTLDDSTGPLDATFFEDAQAGCASTIFHSWLLVIRGAVRRTGRRGISINATGCWDLSALDAAWKEGGRTGVARAMGEGAVVSEQAVHGAAKSRSTRPVIVGPPAGSLMRSTMGSSAGSSFGSPHDSGSAPRRLWHASPGSSGH